ncbi:MAG: gliding motility-associated C-terminal domain-containing protein [Flavobacteriales bacterium]|nr:gliding motility-associated C-terminal domain-containing protein [Flavobacteriales bacterium]
MAEQRRPLFLAPALTAIFRPLFRSLAPLALAVLCLPHEARATHAMGGELTYQCIGPNQYKVILNFYRDCNGVAAPTNCSNGLQFRVQNTACGANFTDCLALESVQVITPICPTEVDRCVSASGTYGVERYTFSKIVNLNAWAGCGTNWIISWELCCRNNSITSLQNPGNQRLYLDARLNNTLTPCNTSPTFLNSPTPFYCLGQPISYNPGAFDPDGDSLDFALINARGLNGANLTYSAGYSAVQPIANSGGANAVVMNPATGTLTCTPSIQQVAVVSYRVREYRNGVLIGEVVRDIQFVIRPCPSNAQPSATGINGTSNFSAQVCAGQPISFTINSSDPNAGQIVTMTWNNGIPGASFSASGSPFPTGTFTWTPTVADIGNNTFAVTVADNACPLVGTNTFGYSILVTPPFTPAYAGVNQQVCGGSVNMTAILPFPGLVGTWSVVSGTGTFANVNDQSTTVTGLSTGTNVFQWNVNYQTCGVATAQVTITSFNPAQPAANAGPDQSFCSPTSSATLAANTAAFPATGTWALVSGSGTITSPNSPTSSVTGLGIGVNRFRWTINNGPCGPPTSDEVDIIVFNNAQPAANAGPDQSICTPASSVTLNGNALLGPATGTWTLVSGSGLITSPNAPSTTVTGLPVGVHTFRWSINNSPCVPGLTQDDVVITVFSATSPNANAGPNQQVCATSASLSGSVPTAPATGAWSLVSGAGTITSPSSPTTTVTGLGVGNNIFQWTVNNGPCTNGITTSQVTITRFDGTAPPANAGPDQNLCGPAASATMAGNAPVSPATGTWTLVSGGGTITSPNSPTTPITGLPVGTNIFRWTINNGPCPGSPSQDDVVLTVFSNTQPAANAGPAQQLCTPQTSTNLAGNAPIAPATGQWTVISGTGAFADATSPTTTVSGLSVGNNVFQWTINNGPCANPITTSQVTVTLFNSANPVANAGPDQVLCTPVTTTTLTGSSLIAPATGTWTLVSGSGVIVSPNNPTTSVNGLGIGVNRFRWTVSNGPCPSGLTQDDVDIVVFSSASPVANAGPDQQLCTPTDFTTMAASVPIAPATGTWSLITGSGTIVSPSSPTTSITGLGIGVNTFRWTVNNGACGGTTTDDVTLTLFAAHNLAADAGPDVEICLPTFPNTVAMTGSSLIFPATGQWSLVSGTANIVDPTSPVTEVNGLGIGIVVLQWTVFNGPCGTTTDQMTINVYNAANPVANAGPDQSLCTPITTTNLLGSALIAPATGQWTLVSGSGVFAAPNSPNTTVSGLSVGVNVFEWTVDNGPCVPGISSDLVTVIVFSGSAQQADAGPDQSLCSSTASTPLAGNAAVLPATGEWSVLQGTANFADATDPNTTVSGLSIGENILVWSIDNGACGVSTDPVSLFVYDENQTDANAGPDQALCTPTQSTNLAGNAVTFPGTGTWTLVSGSGVIANPNSPTSFVSGLSVGVNTFEWTVNNGPCPSGITSDLVDIVVFDQNAAVANAGPDQELCTPANSTALAANTPALPGVGTWTLVSGTGVFADPNAPTTTVSGLSTGTNVFRWTINNGPCGSSQDDVSILLYDATNPDADAGPDQELCTPTSSTTLTGSALIAPATGTWTLVSGTGTIVSPNSPSTALTGLSIGVNTFRWTVSNGPCANALTTDEVSIIIYDGSEPPANAGPDQSLCTPNTSTSLAGSVPNFPASGTWTLVSGTGLLADATDPNTTVTGLSVGANVFEWTITNGPCPGGLTTDQVTILVFDENNPVADAGPDQQLCTPTTTTAMAGSNVIFPATGTWTLVAGLGTIVDPSSPTSQITGLGVGVNRFRWTVSNGPCSTPLTFDEVEIVVFDANNPVANAGPPQILCTPNVNTSLAGSALIFPATGLWTLVSGSGTISDPTLPTSTVTSLGVGENVFQWTVSNGPCGAPTSSQVSIFVFDTNNPNADAGPDQDLCTPVTSAVLAASPVTFPATAQWSVISGTGSFVNANDPNTTVNGLSVGVNILRWTVDNGPCGTGLTSSDVVITLYDENNPVADAGPAQELCTPNTSTTLAGSSVIFPATGQWVVVQGNGIIADPTDPNSAVNGLDVGENIFVWIVDNGPCASGSTSDAVSVFVFDENNPVADAGPDQQLCTPVTSTNLSASTVIFPATGQWSVISGAGTFVDPNDPFTTVTGLAVGVNVFRWTVSNGPCGAPTTDEVTITLFDENNPVANAGPDQELCTPTTNTVLAGSALIFPATGVWSIIQGTGVFADATSPTTSVTGLSTGENIFGWTVSNGPCGPATFDLVSIYVFDENNPVANAGADQQVCTPVTSTTLVGSALIFPATGQWTLVSGAGTIADPNLPFTPVTALGIGENIFEWTVSNGPCGPVTTDQISVFLFDLNAPPADAGADQQACTPNTSTVLTGNTPTAPAIGVWNLVQGTAAIADVNDPASTINGLSVGENILTWTIDNGICGISVDSVSLFIFDEDAPPADAGPDQELCTPSDSTYLAAVPPVFPATGSWSLFSGAGLFEDPADPATKVVGLSIGENVFVWTVNNGPCADPITTDTMTVVLYNDSTAPAYAGPDIEICLPLTFVNMAADVPQLPAIGTWTLLSGTGTIAAPNDPFSLITDLQVGISTFLWTLDNGPCANNGILTDTVQVTIFDPNAPVADAGPDQELCLPTTDATLAGNTPSFPGVGTWTSLGSATITNVNDPATTVSGLSVGDNLFVWTIYNGTCGFGPPSTDTVNVVLFDDAVPPAVTGADQFLCSSVSGAVLQANNVIYPATGQWSVVVGSGQLADPIDPGTLAFNLNVGLNVFVWTVSNGPCPDGVSTDTLQVFVYDEDAPFANAGPDQSICVPTMPNEVTMAGNAPTFPATGQWTLVSGAGTIVDPSDPQTLITDLTPGTHVFQWAIDNGPCPPGITTDLVTITVFDAAQPSANAGADQSVCTPVINVQLAANAVTAPATGQWTIVSGSGSLSSSTDPAATLTGLAPGQTVLVWSINNGPCPNGLSTDTVVVNVFDSNANTALAGPDQSFCTPITDPVTMFANSPVFPAIGTWVLLSGTGAIADPNDPFSVITGLGFGENVFEWSIANGVCGDGADVVSLFVYDGAVAPASAGPDQSLCIPTAQTTLEATATTSTGTAYWTLQSGSGAIVSPSDPNTSVNQLATGENWFVWVVENGECGTTYDSLLVLVEDCTDPLKVPDAFSPNGDGVNDVFVIQGLDAYDVRHLMVFNRYGNKVLDRSPYNNDWDGTSDTGLNRTEKLPESTYYFILDLGEGTDKVTGYIYLRR